MIGLRMRKSGRTPRRGVATVEAAVVLPLLLFVLIAIFEYGRYLVLRQVVSNAVREGARYAVVRSVDSTTFETQVRDAVDNRLGRLGSWIDNYSPSANISVYKSSPLTGANLGSWKDAGFGEAITVEFSGTYRSTVTKLPLPGFGAGLPGVMQLRARCLMFSEAN